MKQEDLIGKFIVAFDTIVDGEQTATNENDEPVLHNSSDDAFRELFDDAVSTLDNYTDAERKEYAKGVTKKLLQAMIEINNNNDVAEMRKFLDENPQCNINDEYVIKAEDFVKGRKTIFTGSQS